MSHNEILLVTAPPWGVHSPPVGLAYLTTYLKSQDIDVSVFDFNIGLYRRVKPEWHKLWLPEYKNAWSNPELFQKLRSEFSADIDWAVSQIISTRAPVVGFSVVDPKERMTIELIRRMLDRDRSKRIILGGPAVSTPEQRNIFIEYLGSAVDYFVVGEGEYVLRDIMYDYRQNNYTLSLDEERQKPLIVKKEIVDLSDVPYPTYEEFDFSLYDGGNLIVEWSRGCISSCAFCKGKKILGSYRMKKAHHIVEEIEQLYAKYNTTYFIVCDNLLNGNVTELGKVCDLLIEKAFPVEWEGQGIPHAKMEKGILKKMKNAGCVKLQWGLETGSDKLLSSIGKGRIFTVKEAREVIQASHQVGIQTELFIIIGLPGEDEEAFKKTYDFIKENHAAIDKIKSINTLHLVHGTELYNQAHAFNICLPESDWHYMWYEKSGNNDYPARVKRTEILLQLADELSIPVQEHNLHEGRIKL